MSTRTARHFNKLAARGSNSTIQPCMKHSLGKYLAFMGVICNASPLKQADNASLLWLWVILSCYDSIEYSDSIKQNSCNAGFTFLSCEKSISEQVSEFETLVVKFQLRPDADNIVLDNVNGYVVNRIAERMPGIRDNFMEYVDSCVSFVDTNKPKPEFPLNDILIASHNMIDNNELINGLTKLKSTMKKCPISICKSVKEPESLTEVIKKDDYDFESLVEKVFDLFATIRLLGGTFGFTHNDAHLGNVLYDGEDHTLVLIDYGRVLFSGNMIRSYDSNLDRDITDQIMYERLKQMNGDLCLLSENKRISNPNYTDFMKADENMSTFLAIPKLLFFCERKGHDFLLKNLYLFDVMCISMNLLLDITKKTLNDNHPFFHLYDEFIGLELADDGITSMVYVSSVEEIFHRLRAKKHIARHHILCLGFFWFAFFIEYLHRMEPELSDNGVIQYDEENQCYIVDLKALADEGLLWHRMQVLSIPDPESFCQVVEKNRGSIQIMIDLLMTQSYQINARNNDNDQKTEAQDGGTRVARPLRSLETKISKASKSRFHKEYKAYAGGGESSFNSMFRAYAPPPSTENANPALCFLKRKNSKLQTPAKVVDSKNIKNNSRNKKKKMFEFL